MAPILAAAAMPSRRRTAAISSREQRRRAAVAGGDRGDVNLPAGIGQADERARTSISASSGWASKVSATRAEVVFDMIAAPIEN